MYYDKLASDTARYNAQLRLKASQSGKKTVESMYNKTGYSMKDRNVRVKDLNTHISNLYKTLTDGQNKDKNFYYSEQGKQMNNEIAMAIDERNNLIKENNDISTAMNIYYKYVSSGAIASPDGGAEATTESEESYE
jgi:predicted  nucleic acid-binding Zn-ribbon protein